MAQRKFTRNRTALIILAIIVLLIIAVMALVRGNIQQTRDEYFLDKEVIVVGLAADLATLATDVSTIDPNITLTLDANRSVSLDDLDLPLGSQSVASAALQGVGNNAACNQLNRDLQINLYSLTGSKDDVESALEAIAQATAGKDLFAEPNWVIGAPWSPTGSPWSPTGSPWSPTGSANEPDQSQPTPATAQDFADQWAFTTIDLASATAVNDADNLAPVRVAIFDTSPLEKESLQAESVVESDNPLAIEISHPPFVATPVPPKLGSREDIQVANHGYFGGSFIHELAPTSDIQLIRVLTKNNRGDMATLNRELLQFMAQASQDNVNAIVNLSLGVPPLKPYQPFAPWLMWEFPPPFALQQQLNSLEIVTQIGECLDVVLVAAAGNDSAKAPQVGNYPANWGTVLGVTASNVTNEQSCYANDGDVAAPGGDGRSPEDPLNLCEPKLHACSGPDCPFSIIGHVHPETLAANAAESHHHWVGTSFATPMVSGLAALLRQLDPTLSAAEVRRAILCGAAEPTSPQQVRVIHVNRTLACAGITP